MITRFIVYFVILVLSGCASQIPTLINLPPNPDPEFDQVINDIDTFKNQFVRWGGKIISVENKENSTWVEILASPLRYNGRPNSKSDYEGRFIARIDGFLEPELYSKDRVLTIFGIIDTEFVKRIDDYPYSYPLVSVKEHYLWPVVRTVQYRYYYPYHHGYYYPYYRSHFGFHHHGHHFGFHHYY
jgi:outer membrane lipoprotein